MSDEVDLPCVLLWCEYSNAHFVWLERIWNDDAEHWEKTGRKLIARAPSSTCRLLRDLIDQQRRNEYAN